MFFMFSIGPVDLKDVQIAVSPEAALSMLLNPGFGFLVRSGRQNVIACEFFRHLKF